MEEFEIGRGPVLLDCESSTVDSMIEESEGYKEFQGKGSEVEKNKQCTDSWQQLVGSLGRNTTQWR